MNARLLAFGLLAVGIMFSAAGRALAAPVLVDAEKGIALNVGAFVQPQFQLTAPATSGGGSAGVGSPDGGPSFDFFLRRVRLMVWGSVTPQLSFFIDTDQPDLGKGGRFDSSMFIQDAFISYAFSPAVKIDAGMMLVPFARHTIEGAIGLHALDYHGQLIRLPAGKIFRDTGVQVRGMLLDDRLHYRLGIFEGVRATPPPAMPATPPPPPLNEHGLPRLTAQLRYNLMGTEPDFFLKGIYFSPTPLISFGIGADMQPAAVYVINADATVSTAAYFAMSFDAFAEYPLSADDEIVAKANFFYYADGWNNLTTPTTMTNGGFGFFIEGGYRYGWIEPLVYFEYLRGGDNTLELVSPHVGANAWLTQHNFNLKFDFGYRHVDQLNMSTGIIETDEDILFTLQAQLYF